jgi:hypothetical protein
LLVPSGNLPLEKRRISRINQNGLEGADAVFVSSGQWLDGTGW